MKIGLETGTDEIILKTYLHRGPIYCESFSIAGGCWQIFKYLTHSILENSRSAFCLVCRCILPLNDKLSRSRLLSTLIEDRCRDLWLHTLDSFCFLLGYDLLGRLGQVQREHVVIVSWALILHNYLGWLFFELNFWHDKNALTFISNHFPSLHRGLGLKQFYLLLVILLH